MAGISATGQDKVKKGFAPLLEGFHHLPFGDIAAVKAAIGPKTAGILLEPVQGEGGINIASGDFLRQLRQLADEHNLLLLFDEIQCGLGRTGEWCGWRSLAPDIQPDGVSWAKGIANGVPLGAFWASSNRGLCDLLGPGTHGTTYGGNPLVSAVGNKVLEIIERDNLLENAKARAHSSGRPAGREPSVHRHSTGTRPDDRIELAPGITAIDSVKSLMAGGLLTIPAESASCACCLRSMSHRRTRRSHSTAS